MNNRPRNSSGAIAMPFILIGVGVLLVIGVLAYVMINGAGNNTAQAPQATLQETPIDQIQRVSLANAKAAFDSQSATFVDVRDVQSYNQGHIPGAVNIPLAELESHLNELNPNQWIITYCT